MTHPEISVVITGADTAEQLDNNVKSVDLRLSDDDIAELNRVSAEDESLRVVSIV
jgi:aryl-alcohol dehydrogenase-like predicted oxidoreductase